MAELTIEQLKSLGWAQEATLRILSDKAGSSNALLKEIARKQGVEETKLAAFNDALGQAATGLTERQKQELEATRATVNKLRADREIEANKREINSKYKQSVDDLRTSLGKISNLKAENVFELAQGGLAKWSGKLSESTGAATSVAGSLRLLNIAVTLAAAAFGIYAQTNTSFLKMVDTGLLFNGSLEQFASIANKSGLGIEKFAEIAGKYSQAVSMIGEKQFALNVRTFQDLSKASGYFGMMPEKLAEAQAVYVDGLRESGLLHKLNSEQQNTLTKEYLSSLTGLSKLTGRQRDQLEAEQKTALRKQQIELKKRALSQEYGPEYAARVERQYGMLVSTMGTEFAEAAFSGRFLGGFTPEQAKMLGVTGSTNVAMQAGQALGGTNDQLMNTMESAAQHLGNLPASLLNTLSSNIGLGGSLAGTNFLTAIQRAEKLNAMSPQDRAEARRLMAGGAPTDKTNQGYLKTQYDIAKIQGDLKAATWDLAEQMSIFNRIMGTASFGTGIIASIASMVGPGIMGAVGLGVGLKYLSGAGLFAGAGGLNALSGLTTGMGGRMGSLFGRGAGNVYGPPPPPSAGGGGLGGLGGAGGLAMRGLGGAGVGALAGSVAGMGLGAMGAGDRTKFWGSILAGAGGGALMGMGAGPIGIAVGAIAGGLGAWLTTNTDQSAADAGAGAGGGAGIPTDLVSSTVALTTSLVTNGAYISALVDMMTSVAAVQAARGGAGAPFGAGAASPDVRGLSSYLTRDSELGMLLQEMAREIRLLPERMPQP